MIAHAYDRDSSALVAHVWGASTDDAVGEFVTIFRQLDTGATPGTMPITVIEVDAQADRLTARQRQTLADAFASARSPVHLIAVATTSAIHRGVGKVIAWLSPHGERRRATFHVTVGDAFRWCEGQRDTTLPVLKMLHDHALAKTASSQGRIRKSANDRALR